MTGLASLYYELEYVWQDLNAYNRKEDPAYGILGIRIPWNSPRIEILDCWVSWVYLYKAIGAWESREQHSSTSSTSEFYLQFTMKFYLAIFSIFAASAISSAVPEGVKMLLERQLPCTTPCVNGKRCCGGNLTYRCNACWISEVCCKIWFSPLEIKSLI